MLQVIDDRSPEAAIRLRPLPRALFERLCRWGDVDTAALELMCGAVIDRRDDDPERARVVAQVAARLRARAGPAGRVAVRAPWAIDDFSMPRPDVRVAATGGHCELGVRTTPLVVEVTRGDGGERGATRRDLYARAPLAEYWRVDLDAAVIEAWRGPDPRFGAWGTVTRYRHGEAAIHATRPALALTVDEIVPRRQGSPRLRSRPGAATPSR